MGATWPRPSGRDTNKRFSTISTNQHGKVRASKSTNQHGKVRESNTLLYNNSFAHNN